MSFGRKGVEAGAGFGPVPRTIGARAPIAPEPVHDPYAEKRAAFLAQERAAGGFALGELRNDAMAQEAQRDGTAAWQMPTSRTWDKSVAIAYLLWFFVGVVAAHRLYTGRYVSAAVQTAIGFVAVGMLMTLRRDGLGESVGGDTGTAGIAMLLFMAYGLWRLVDLFLIPGMCRKPPQGY